MYFCTYNYMYIHMYIGNSRKDDTQYVLLGWFSCVSAVCHSRRVSSVTQQMSPLCDTTDISAVPHSRHVSGLTPADMSAVSHSRYVCWCETAEMSAV